MKPWEEDWASRPCQESVARGDPHGSGHICLHPRNKKTGESVDLSLEENAKLAAQAPAMARLLLYWWNNYGPQECLDGDDVERALRDAGVIP